MTAAFKPKHQRLVLALVAGAVMLLAGLAAAWGLRAQASYFYLPAQILA
ncbi:cytochrome c maturation protein CcmE, partial [Francisella tularensis]|nr:cytochrome c maturation protein CcmE [Francisella tularensis]